MNDNKVLINLTNLAITASGNERSLLVAQHRELSELLQKSINESFEAVTTEYKAAQDGLDALAEEIKEAQADVKRIVGVIEKATKAIDLLTKLVDKVL